MEHSQLLLQGRLADAIRVLEEGLRDDPTSMDLRANYIELLCVDGQLEQADRQLDMVVRQFPQCLAGAVNLRRLIRAQQARLDFQQGAATARFTGDSDDSVAAMMSLRMVLSADPQQLIEQAAQLERLREPVALAINGKRYSNVRDIDDTLCGYLELFGTDGQYYLVRIDQLISLVVKPVESLIDQYWRRVEVEIDGGLSGDAFMPTVYLNTGEDGYKLGRETDWIDLAQREVFQGRGRKLWLADDTVVDLFGLEQLQQVCCAETAVG